MSMMQNPPSLHLYHLPLQGHEKPRPLLFTSPCSGFHLPLAIKTQGCSHFLNAHAVVIYGMSMGTPRQIQEQSRRAKAGHQLGAHQKPSRIATSKLLKEGFSYKNQTCRGRLLAPGVCWSWGLSSHAILLGGLAAASQGQAWLSTAQSPARLPGKEFSS